MCFYFRKKYKEKGSSILSYVGIEPWTLDIQEQIDVPLDQ